ncbi:MAG: NFACT family protein [Clostridia bacterium]|nr:NFACT family protein [Clostridia bacterium]
MPMDGVMLGFVARELDAKLRDGRVDRVIQPERDEIHLIIRAQGANHRLVLSASANAARVHLSEHAKTGPMEPPMFCMLLRKYLGSGRVQAVRRIAGDRILEIDISALSELGDPITRTLVIEIMGRHSNIILRSSDGRIVDAARHIGEDISRVRQVLPGLPYSYPPSQGKLNPETATAQEIAQRLIETGGKLDKAVGGCIAGFSPQAAREACARIGLDTSVLISEIDVPAAAQALHGYLAQMPAMGPCVINLTDDGAPGDIYPFRQLHLPMARVQEYHDGPSAALDAYFYERDRRERMNQRASSLAHTLKNHIERCEKKIAIQNEALEGAARMEEYRQKGELIQANLYRLKKGEALARVENFYTEDCASIDIPMDVSLSPAQNAQRYFKLYQKARGARTLAAEQKAKAEQELEYLEQMEDDLRKCTDAQGLAELRAMLEKSGHVRQTVTRMKPRREAPSQPMKFLSCDGIEIEVGKNALQNERLTMGAKGDELWLHAQKMPGSHVLVHAADVPETTLQEAAMLAAYYSKGVRSAQVPIDATLRRYIKKPGGTPAGFVIYTHQRTLYITPDEAAVKRIKCVRE